MLVLELVLKLVIAVWHKTIIVFHRGSAHSRTSRTDVCCKNVSKSYHVQRDFSVKVSLRSTWVRQDDRHTAESLTSSDAS